jgi:anti-sigma B factor antagonist
MFAVSSVWEPPGRSSEGAAVLVRTTESGTRSILVVEGEVDAHTAPQLKAAIATALDKGSTEVIADLDQVTFMDSTGLGVLVGGLKRLREVGGELRIVCSRRPILRILEITGLDKVIPLYSALAQATSV